MKSERLNIKTGPVFLEYIKWGEKKPEFLFIHGFGGSAKTFSRVIEPLVNVGRASISISLPYHGGSEDSKGVFDLALYSNSIMQVLKTHFDVDSVHIVAHSLGARLALWMAVNMSQTVKSVHIMNPAGFYPWEIRFFSSFKKGFGAWLLSFDNIARIVTSFLVANASKRMSDAFRFYSKSYDLMCLHRTKVFMQLFKIRVPVHIYWGDKDRLLPLSFAKEVQQHFFHAELHVLPNCGHLPMIDQPLRLVELLQAQTN
jgi:pimeloyl-ACP methyl ester carboxylesterase